MSHLRTKTITHKQAVCALYKKAIRNIEAWVHVREDARYDSVLMRARFDANKNVTDPRQAKMLYLKGVEELEEKQHPVLKRNPMDPYGSAYERWNIVPDWVLDYWHPYEKARYPKYFATREKRKLEYLENWEKQKAQWETAEPSGH